MKWEYKTLDQLGTVSRGKSKHRPRNDPKLFGGKYPFIQTADVKNADYYITKYSDTYNESGLAQSKLWDKGTLCITIAANIADTGVLAFPACFPDSIMGFVPFEGVANTRFIKYCFDRLQRDCKQISQGTAQDNLSWEKLSTIKFCIPEYKEQCRIADILSAYDDLIENNQKQIKLLEEAAQRLYKEWFVDLNFPGHENTKIVDGVPEGWQWCKVRDIADINSSALPKNYKEDFIDYVDLGSVRCGHIETKTRYNLNEAPGRAKRCAKDGDIIWGMVRPNLKAYALVTNPEETDVFSTGFAVLSAKKVPYSYLYCAVTQEEFVGYLVNATNGAAYPAVKPVHFEVADILKPDDKVLEQFHSVADLIFRKIEMLDKQNHNLSEARDLLLPKLMNGEVEV